MGSAFKDLVLIVNPWPIELVMGWLKALPICSSKWCYVLQTDSYDLLNITVITFPKIIITCCFLMKDTTYLQINATMSVLILYHNFPGFPDVIVYTNISMTKCSFYWMNGSVRYFNWSWLAYIVCVWYWTNIIFIPENIWEDNMYYEYITVLKVKCAGIAI